MPTGRASLCAFSPDWHRRNHRWPSPLQADGDGSSVRVRDLGRWISRRSPQLQFWLPRPRELRHGAGACGRTRSLASRRPYRANSLGGRGVSWPEIGTVEPGVAITGARRRKGISRRAPRLKCRAREREQYSLSVLASRPVGESAASCLATPTYPTSPSNSSSTFAHCLKCAATQMPRLQNTGRSVHRPFA